LGGADGRGPPAGLVIGVVTALLGVAGGELLIPALIRPFGVDIELAGSLSLAVSLPTMLVGFFRYSRMAECCRLGRSRSTSEDSTSCVSGASFRFVSAA
jgi:hypothetical protein